MENRRANDGCGVLLWRGIPSRRRGRSPIGVTAMLAIAALLAVVLWQLAPSLKANNTDIRARSAFGAAQTAAAATSSDAAGELAAGSNDFSRVGTDAFGRLIGTYVSLKRSGEYTPAQGAALASAVADNVSASVSYTPYAAGEVRTDPDTSYRRMLAYRADLRAALSPLLSNTKPELGIFGAYAETGDAAAFAQLMAVAGRYRDASGAAMGVTVPKDAVAQHVAVANSLLRFASTLEAMGKNANDPMATLALLRAYNDAERGVFTSFDALASYEKSKLP